MDSLTRLETAWAFREPDRVPVELTISARARALPEARRLVEFIDREADNFMGVPGFDWGFFGLDAAREEEVIEDVPGAFRRKRETFHTAAGDFAAVTRHRHDEFDPRDFHWEHHHLRTVEDLVRLTEAPRRPRPFRMREYQDGVARIARLGMAVTGLFHPLGQLVRASDLDQVYTWLACEPAKVHRFLEVCCGQAIESLQALNGAGVKPVFVTWALEMLIPPWIGRRMFDEFVFPYDKAVNDAVHGLGGRHRAHCHGRSGAYVARFAEMGIDALEPLEPAPYGDNVLAEAKRDAAGRMLLSGNILSQDFLRMSPEEVRAAVRRAIREGAPGGGFALRCASGECATGSAKDMAQLKGFVERAEVYMDAAVEYGRYPIR